MSHGTGVRGHSVIAGGASDGYGSSDTDTDTASVLCLACSQFPFSFQYSAFPVYQPFFYSPCDLSCYQYAQSHHLNLLSLLGREETGNEGPLPPIDGSTEEGPGISESTSRTPLTDGTEMKNNNNNNIHIYL